MGVRRGWAVAAASVIAVSSMVGLAPAAAEPHPPAAKDEAVSAPRPSLPVTEEPADLVEDASACIPTGANRSRGEQAVERLGDDIDAAAGAAGLTGDELQDALLEDDTLWVDACGRPFYIDPAEPAALASAGIPEPQAAVLPYAETFKLHSRPDANRVVYLDFDGMHLSGSSWASSFNNGVAWTAVGFDTDGNPATFSNAERETIQGVWQRVSEDFAPFDIDVTTEDPGFDAIDRSSTADQRYGTRALISNDTVIGGSCNCAGVAYLGVFDLVGGSLYQPAFISTAGTGGTARYLAETITHEVGHNLGLSHDGKTSGCGTGGLQPCEYYPGAGAWTALMGGGDKPISQWSKGEYPGATNTEDDFVVVADNGGPAPADDHGDTTATATALPASLPSGITGEITSTADVDMFSFTSAGGATTFSVVPSGVNPNLDAKVSVYNSAGTLVGSADPASAMVSADVASGLNATYTSGALTAGTYYVGVDGVGQGNIATTGYSDYASVGRYSLSVATTAGPAVATTVLPDTVTGVGYRANLAAAGGTTPYTWSITGGSLPAGLTLGADGALTGTPTGTANATFTVRVSDSAARTATRTFTVAAGVSVTTQNLPEATRGTAYSTNVAAAGGTGVYTWTVSSGSLPTGLAMSSAGVITGTPTVAQTATFTVQATDGASRIGRRVVTITVAAPLTFSAINTSVPLGGSGGAYLYANGGRPSYVWALESGSVPTGMRFNDNGWVTGTPTVGGTFSAVVRATDRSGRTGTTTLAITVNGFAFSPASLPAAVSGASYSQALSITYAGTTAPITWTLAAGPLPSGITLSGGGLLGGTSSTSGSYPITVRATDAAGWTDTKAYTLVVAAVPGAPTAVGATAGNGQATVTWTAPASDGGSPITGYVVTPYLGATAQTPVSSPGTGTSRVVTGLTNGSSYTFRVAAVNAFGTGAVSGPSAAVTPRTVPGAPTGVSAVPGNAQAAVSWTAPVSDGGAAVTGYVVTPYIGATAQSSSLFDASATTRTITGLTNGSSYTFRVAATNVAGTGAASAASSAVTPRTVPGAPTAASAVPGNGQAVVSWTAPASNGGSPLTGYVVTPYIGIVAQSSTSFDATGTARTITGLTNGTSYTFRIAAVNAAGAGADSGPSAAVTPRTVPGAPTGVSAVPGDQEATVSWTAPVSDGGSAITGYVVTPYVGATAQSSSLFDASETTRTVTGLTNGTVYTFRVVAANVAGTGAASAASGAVTPRSLPGAPTGVSATAGDQQVAVSWTAPASDGGSPLTGYVVTPYIGATAQTAATFASTATSQTITGLTNGTAYTFRVAAMNASGTGTPSVASAPVTPRTVPGAPTEVSAVPGNGQAAVSWTAPASNGGSPLTGYVVTPYLGATAQSSSLFDASETTRTITGLTNGSSYTFRVAATNAAGTGAASSASAPVTPRTVPGAPTGVSAVPGNGQAVVSWSAPASNGGSAVTDYVVTPYIGATAQTPVASSGTGTSRVVTGLANGTAYTFRVAAMNASGTGTPSVASAPVIPRTVPGAPTGVSAVPGNGQAVVSWTVPASNGGSPLTGYVVTPYIGIVAQSSTSFDATSTARTITGLTNGTSYTFRIAAVNAAGTGEDSGPSAAVTPRTVPGAPTAVSATAGDAQATVSWAAPASNGGSAVTGYVVTPYVGATAQSSSLFDASATTRTVTGLTNGTAYTFRVAAANVAGTGAASAASVAVTPVTPPGVPGAPTAVTATPGNAQVTVNWTAPASTGGSAITGYVVTPFIGATAQTPAASSGTGTSKVVTGLTNGTAYTFRVAAVNAVGTGTPSAASSAVTPRTVPGAPTGVSAVPGNAQVTVNWTAPASTGGSAITGYVVTPFIGATAQTPAASSGTGTSKVVTGLANGTAYTFRVAAVNAAGTGSASAASDPVTPATTPGTPSAVAATAGIAQATVSWAAPASNGGSPITGYVVTPYIGATAQTPVSSPGTGTSRVVTGLTSGTAYTFRVAAVNAVGTGSASAASSAVTPQAPPGAPGAPTSAAATPGDGQATVSWTAPSSDGGSPITAYVVTPFVGAVAQAPVSSSGTGTSKVVTGLTNGTAYTFRVAATNAIGTGAPSAASAAVTPAAVPGAPTTVTVTAGNGQATVSWTAPASTGGSAITGYVVTPFIGATAQTPVASPGAGTSRVVTGLTNGTAYTFRVAATNALGTGSPSAASTSVTPVAPIAPWAPFASWSAFVTRQYRDVTNSAPSASARSSWVSQLTSGAKTKGDLVTALRTSADNTANVDATTRLYRSFLGRAPDASGLKFWIGRRRSGTWTLNRMADSFASSSEFKRKYGTLTNRQFVTRIYTDVLGRASDPSGVDYWTSQLDRKRRTRGSVMTGFSESNEYKRRQAENTDVAVAYILLMGRAATVAETDDWVARQKAGTTHAALLTELLSSAKYAARVGG